MPIYQYLLSLMAPMYRVPGSHGTKQMQSWFSKTFLQISEIISPGDSGACDNVFGFKTTWWIFVPWILLKFFALIQNFYFYGITWQGVSLFNQTFNEWGAPSPRNGALARSWNAGGVVGVVWENSMIFWVWITKKKGLQWLPGTGRFREAEQKFFMVIGTRAVEGAEYTSKAFGVGGHFQTLHISIERDELARDHICKCSSDMRMENNLCLRLSSHKGATSGAWEHGVAERVR